MGIEINNTPAADSDKSKINSDQSQTLIITRKAQNQGQSSGIAEQKSLLKTVENTRHQSQKVMPKIDSKINHSDNDKNFLNDFLESEGMHEENEEPDNSRIHSHHSQQEIEQMEQENEENLHKNQSQPYQAKINSKASVKYSQSSNSSSGDNSNQTLSPSLNQSSKPQDKNFKDYDENYNADKEKKSINKNIENENLSDVQNQNHEKTSRRLEKEHQGKLQQIEFESESES